MTVGSHAHQANSLFFNLNDTPVTVFTTAHCLTMSWDEWHTYYSIHNSPQLDHNLNQMTSLTVFTTVHYLTMSWDKDTLITVFTTVHDLTMSSAKWHISYCVHNSLELDHVLNQITYLLPFSQHSSNLTTSSAEWHTYYSVQNSPQLDHILSQMALPLLC